MAKLRRGDPITRIDADTWNRLVDTLPARVGGSLPAAAPLMDRAVVRVRNDSADELLAYYAVAIGSPIVTRADNASTFFQRPTFRATKPTGDTARIAVMIDRIEPGRIGRAVVSGITYARLTVPHERHTHAVLTPDAYTLTSTGGGYPLLWLEPEGERTGGSAWAIVCLGQTEAPIRNAEISGYDDPDDKMAFRGYLLDSDGEPLDGNGTADEIDIHAVSIPTADPNVPGFGRQPLDECNPLYNIGDPIRVQWQSNLLRVGAEDEMVEGYFAVDTFQRSCEAEAAGVQTVSQPSELSSSSGAP